MGNRHVHQVECLQTLGTSESGRQKVTALNLFYPTTSLPFAKSRFLGIATQPQSRGLTPRASYDAYFNLKEKGKYQVMILFKAGEKKSSAGIYYEVK